MNSQPVSGVCGFRFDIVVVRVDSSTVHIDNPALVDVNVQFLDTALKVTPSRINVVQFPPDRSYEFREDIKKLTTQMQITPLMITVNYDGELVGMGQISWPDHIVSEVGKLREVTHVADCELVLEDEEESKVGSISVIVRIQPKCQEFEAAEGEGGTIPGDDDIEHLEKVVNPQDVIFVVADPSEVPGCMGLSLKTSDTMQKLNFNNLRPLHGTIQRTPDALNTCCNLDCCGIKKVKDQYTDDVIKKLTCANVKGRYRRQTQVKAKCIKCAIDEKDKSDSDQDKKGDVNPNCVCRPVGSGMMGIMSGPGGNEPAIFSPPKKFSRSPPPPLNIDRNRPPRRCPVCNANHDWLPPMAACPQCCYKPMPYVEECPCVENLTADEILREYLDREDSSNDCASEGSNYNDKPQCRCTCTAGRICPYCRIRKACENIFQPNYNPDNNRLHQNKGKVNEENMCADESKEDCRPFLARVFSELKDLYDIKDGRGRKGGDEDCHKRMGGGKDSAKKGSKKTYKKKYNTGKSYDEPSTACKDIEELRKKAVGRKGRREVEVCQQVMCPKTAGGRKARCSFKVKKIRMPKCQQCIPLGGLPCEPKKQNPCGTKLYDYCAVRQPLPKCTNHKVCFEGDKRVPCNMGWLWNTDKRLMQKGWKPGAIRKSCRQLMAYFLRDFPADTLIVSKYCYRKPPKKKIENIEQKTTLHICKRNNQYLVTFQPLKDPESLKQAADPYLDMKPIQFKITKDPVLVELSKLKRCLKKMGFAKCTCHQPVIMCHCRSYVEKKRLEFEMNKECRKRQLPSCGGSLVLSDTSDSECEFDFGVTPPAGIVKRSRLYKPDLANQGTQYSEADWNVKALFPQRLHKSAKDHKCAHSERKKVDEEGMDAGPPEKKDKASGGDKPAYKKPQPPEPPKTKVDNMLEKNPELAKLLGKDGKLDMMKYMKAHKDLTPEEKRRRRELLKQMSPPPLDSLARKGKPEPCVCIPCCNPCCDPCYDPCCRPCYPC